MSKIPLGFEMDEDEYYENQKSYCNWFADTKVFIIGDGDTTRVLVLNSASFASQGLIALCEQQMIPPLND